MTRFASIRKIYASVPCAIKSELKFCAEQLKDSESEWDFGTQNLPESLLIFRCIGDCRLSSVVNETAWPRWTLILGRKASDPKTAVSTYSGPWKPLKAMLMIVLLFRELQWILPVLLFILVACNQLSLLLIFVQQLNVTQTSGRPSSFSNWFDYETLIDRFNLLNSCTQSFLFLSRAVLNSNQLLIKFPASPDSNQFHPPTHPPQPNPHPHPSHLQ